MDHSPGMSFNGSPAMGQPQYHEMQPVHYQHNGHQRHPPMPMATEAHFRVSEWQQPYDSGVHSLQHSQNPSVMSMPGSSRMSVVSVANTADLTDLQRQKFENIPLSFDAAQPEAASAAIPDLINLINDEDVTVAARALGFIQLTAKRDSETKFQKPIIHQLEAVKAIVELLEARQDLIPLIRHALGSLFYISNRPEGTQLVLIANHQLNGLMVRKLIDFIRNPETPYQKWAIPLLHTLIVDTKNSQVNIRQACDCGGVEALTHRLYYEANQKLLSIIVQSINILTVKNPAQTKLFFDQKGPDRLVQILGEFQYEGLLIGTVRFIGKLGAHADKLGALNAPLAVARCLHHGSHRLVDLSLDCLRNLSHSKTMQKQTEIVDFVIQVLGSSNLKHIQYCLDILTNMCTESKPNKERLCGNGRTVEYLISLLTLPYDLGSEKDNAGKDELQETVLLLLRILCHDHDYTRDVQHQLIQQGGCMWNMLQTMKPKLLWRTLQLIRRLENHLGMFAEARFGTETFAKTVVRILNIALSKLDMGSVDNVKVVDILQAALTVLSLFCHNGSLRDQIAADLLLPQNMTIQGGENVYLPVLVLQKNYPGKDEKTMKQPAMGIIAATVAHPQVAMRFKNDPIYMNGLHAMCRLPDYAPLAEIALKTLQEGVQPVYPPLRCAPPTTAGGPDRRFPPQRPSSPVQPEGPLPDDLAAIDDPFVNVFCPNQSHNSPPFSSPTDYQSPPSNSNPPSCRPPYDQMHPMNYQPDPYGSAHYGHHPPHQQYPPQQYYPAQQPYPQYYEQYPGGDYRYPPP